MSVLSPDEDLLKRSIIFGDNELFLLFFVGFIEFSWLFWLWKVCVTIEHLLKWFLKVGDDDFFLWVCWDNGLGLSLLVKVNLCFSSSFVPSMFDILESFNPIFLDRSKSLSIFFVKDVLSLASGKDDLSNELLDCVPISQEVPISLKFDLFLDWFWFWTPLSESSDEPSGWVLKIRLFCRQETLSREDVDPNKLDFSFLHSSVS